ncbi:MAG: urease accessory protein UreF [Streptosporangiales bacterium]|nr:urease accessory protein UreF [Streptosporangiales bacterium]
MDASAVALLMLADSRLPSGGHAHSGGVEPAMTTGTVRDLDDLDVFLRGRLRTVGTVSAAVAAATCHRLPRLASDELWRRLDAETDARTASPAQRAASRHQGRALLRTGCVAWPARSLTSLAAYAADPHHAVVLGAVGAAAGCPPAGVARVAAYLAVSGPASAALRLRGLDPLAVQALLATLAGPIENVAAAVAAAAAAPLDDLPCPTAPRLDLLAEIHRCTEVRLFAS